MDGWMNECCQLQTCPCQAGLCAACRGRRPGGLSAWLPGYKIHTHTHAHAHTHTHSARTQSPREPLRSRALLPHFSQVFDQRFRNTLPQLCLGRKALAGRRARLLISSALPPHLCGLRQEWPGGPSPSQQICRGKSSPLSGGDSRWAWPEPSSQTLPLTVSTIGSRPPETGRVLEPKWPHHILGFLGNSALDRPSAQLASGAWKALRKEPH